MTCRAEKSRFVRLVLSCACLGAFLLVFTAQAAETPPALELYTYPDRFPSQDPTSEDNIRQLLYNAQDFTGDHVPENYELWIDGELSQEVVWDRYVTVISTGAAEHDYQLRIEDNQRSNILTIEWSDSKPAFDAQAYWEKVPGGATVVVIVVALGVGFTVMGVTRDPTQTLGVTLAIFALGAVVTPFQPLLWALVVLSAVGVVVAWRSGAKI